MKKLLFRLKESEFVFKIFGFVFSMIAKLPRKKNTIVFESFFGKQYSDNPKAIYLYMKEHYPEYDLYWSVGRGQKSKFKSVDQNLISRFSPRWVFIMARAEYWVTNSRLPLWIPKPKGTTYVQTWHGTPLKKLALDMDEVHMPGNDTEAYKRDFVIESSKWDYLISPNAYSTEIFKRAFKFNKTIIESGYPRNDILINSDNEDSIQRIKKNAKLPRDKRIILYAPTWRDDEYYSVGKYKFNMQLDLDKLYKELGDDYIVLFRLHYLVSENLDFSKYKGFAYNFSDYEDINELYLISDLLITDYSSVFFDYAILKRPIIFFTYDIESYRDNLRGFYFDIEKNAPGPLVRNTAELIHEVKRFEQNDYKVSERFEVFHRRFCSLEKGTASKQVVRVILNE